MNVSEIFIRRPVMTVLLNLAKSLAHHKWALERQLQQQQDGAHVPPRVREQLHQRAADLTDTLRTILCL